MWRRIDAYQKKIKDNWIRLFLVAFFFVIAAVIFLDNPARSIAQHTPSLENGVYALSPNGEKGGAIIPASCPSYEHVAGECNGPAWISGSCPAPGDSATVTWASSVDADHYLLRVDNTSDGDGFTCPASATDICNDNQLGTSLTFGSVAGATYSAWVHWINSAGEYSTATGTSFTCDTTPPPIPAPPAWISGSCLAPGDSATVTWASSAGADHYLLRVDNTSDGDGFTCPASATDICNDNQLGTSLTFGSVAGATYSAWVHGCNSTGCSVTATGSSFICVAPLPVPPVPAWISGSCPAPGDSATVTWASSAGADHYLLRVDNTSDGFTCPAGALDICNNNELGTSLTFGSVAGATYNAWVHAANSAGFSAPASTSFTCGVVATPTPTPTATRPLPTIIETPPQ